MLARLESHPLAAGKNGLEFICAVHGTNSAKLFAPAGAGVWFWGSPGEGRGKAVGMEEIFVFSLDKWRKSQYNKCR